VGKPGLGVRPPTGGEISKKTSKFGLWLPALASPGRVRSWQWALVSWGFFIPCTHCAGQAVQLHPGFRRTPIPC